MRVPTAALLGVPVGAVDLEGAAAAVLELIAEGRAGAVAVTSVHGLVEAQRSAGFLRILRSCALVVPDGRPLVWLMRAAGWRGVEQVTGYELTLAVSALLADRGWAAYYYGGPPGAAETMAAVLTARFPGLSTAGTETPPFEAGLPAPRELSRVAERINDSRARVVWVGLGTPKQERWMAQVLPLVRGPALIGVGAVFDFLTGRSVFPPPGVRRLGLGWLHRLLQEPRRLWRRYAVGIPLFGYYVARARLRGPVVRPAP